MTVQPQTTQFLPSLQRSASNVFAPIQREFDRLFDQLGTGWTAIAELEHAPRMDVRDTKDGLEITVELPGIAQGDVSISVDENVLTIRGEKKAEKETKQEHYRVSERTYGAFSRSISLPSNVDVDKISATMADGVLKLVAPKTAGVQAKTIEIQSAKP